MEIIGVILIIIAVIAPFVEGLAAWNMLQFFRGKKTPLEKIMDKHKE